jgi:hypothetical protein
MAAAQARSGWDDIGSRAAARGVSGAPGLARRGAPKRRSSGCCRHRRRDLTGLGGPQGYYTYSQVGSSSPFSRLSAHPTQL